MYVGEIFVFIIMSRIERHFLVIAAKLGNKLLVYLLRALLVCSLQFDITHVQSASCNIWCHSIVLSDQRIYFVEGSLVVRPLSFLPLLANS